MGTKTLAYFPAQTAKNGQEPLQAFLEGMRKQGYTPVENSMDADVAVIWSVLWHGTMARNEAVYRHYCKQFKPVIILEVGALARGRLWKASVDHTTADGWYGHTQDLNWDRPKQLGLELRTPGKPKDHIVVAMQHQRSLQVENVNYLHWISQRIAHLRQYTDREIVLRTHPRYKTPVHITTEGVTVEHPVKIPNTYDSFDLDLDAHCIINMNSGPGIQGVINGTRVIVDETSLAHPMGIESRDIESAYMRNRDEWFTQICHTEYTVEEFKQGVPYMRMRDFIENH